MLMFMAGFCVGCLMCLVVASVKTNEYDEGGHP